MILLNQGDIYGMLEKKTDSTFYCIFKAIEIEVAGYKLFLFVYANKKGENPKRIICRISFIFKRLYESNMSSFLYWDICFMLHKVNCHKWESICEFIPSWQWTMSNFYTS